MGKKGDRPPDRASDAPAGPFHNPFGGLGKLREGLPTQPSKSTPGVVPLDPKGPARAVVRLERKGRGGKEATVVSHLELSSKELERWVGELKRSLGCGGQVEGDLLVFQGDQRDRVAPLLEARGVRKVTLG